MRRKNVCTSGWPGLFLLGVLLAATPRAAWAQQAGSLPQAPVEVQAQEQAQQPPPQKPLPDAPTPAADANQKGGTAPATEKKPYVPRFWDQTNCLLFAGVLGARYLDFASTLNARRRGLNEALLNNETVDNHAAFAVIEFAGAATSVGVSYLFHRANHHRLERWTSIIHIGVTTFGAIRNFALKTPHPAPTPTP
jgi:hypothetical protein